MDYNTEEIQQAVDSVRPISEVAEDLTKEIKKNKKRKKLDSIIDEEIKEVKDYGSRDEDFY